MTCRLLELKMHVNEILMEMMIDSLTVAEWGRLEEVKNLLESFAVNTDLLQTDALSLSYVDPFSLDLECHFSCSILINPWHELWWYAATFFVDPWYNITQLQSTTCFSMLPRSQCWFVITYTSHDATVGSHKPLCNRRGRWMMFYNVEINTTKISMYYIRNKSFLKIKVRIKFWFRLFVLQQRERWNWTVWAHRTSGTVTQVQTVWFPIEKYHLHSKECDNICNVWSLWSTRHY